MPGENMIVQQIRKELRENADEKYRQSIQRFFKEEIKLLGVKTPIFRKITKKYFPAIKDRPKQEIFSLCEGSCF
jgi:3-methyladenine DNA glycosylase AlkD